VAHGRVTVPATAHEVFGLVHDYPRRLEWDTLLRAAYLDDGNTKAARGATSVCVGKWYLGSIALKTVYVSFDRPAVAAVKMLNRPPFFDSWAASIRHEDIGDGTSTITYTFHFTAKPRFLRFFLDPLMEIVFDFEVRKRLRALKRYFELRPGHTRDATTG
jgi:hypothetical protein